VDSAKQKELERHLAAAMGIAVAHNESPVQRITVDATATGQYPYRVVPANEDFILCGLTDSPAADPIPEAASTARSGASGGKRGTDG
jgi:hypothetical protein